MKARQDHLLAACRAMALPTSKPRHLLLAGALLVVAAMPAGPVAAQSAPAAPASAAPPQRTSPPKPVLAWVPKKSPAGELQAPNRLWWKLADVRALHAGEASWTQPVVRNKDLSGDWHQLAAGANTTPLGYSDNRTAIIVWDGELRVSLAGSEPFTATRGFEIDVPIRVPFTLESVGSTPALYFQLNDADDMPIYPVDSVPAKPAPVAGWDYEQRLVPTPPGRFDEHNQPYLDYYGEVVNGKQRPGAFIADQHMFVNNIRGRATPTPPASNLGHFHVGYDEFWFVMEGNVDLQVEGEPVFTASAGDIIYAPQGRWHRASFGGPVGQPGTRVAMNPYPEGGHIYTVESAGRQ